MNRTTFLVDGFNVYHSLCNAEEDFEKPVKWLNLRTLLSSYLPTISTEARLAEIFYFSALATHLDARKPGVTARHRFYVECLESTGVIPLLGRFKEKMVHCVGCDKDNLHHEEKETDVAISVKLMELLYRDQADTIVLVTGDTDLAPAVRAAKRLFPAKQICFAFPYKRKSKELAKMVSKSFKISKENYLAHQFPDPFKLVSGRVVSRPDSWKKPQKKRPSGS